MFTRTLLCLGLLAAAPFAQGNVWLVDNVACPASDFTSIQDAVDAAADGDTILVRASTPTPQLAFHVDAKALTLVAVGPVTVGSTLDLNVALRDLDPTQRLVLRGFDLDSGIDVTNCAGPVWIEDCSVTTLQLNGAQPALFAQDSASVTVVGCELLGASGETGPFASPGLLVDASSVFVYDSTLTGGDGDDNPNVARDGGAGAEVLADSFLLLSGVTARGGDGGADPILPCQDGGVGGTGGAGLALADVQLAAWAFGSTLIPGVGQSSAVCSAGPDGLPVDGPGAFHLQELGGPARGFSAPSLGLEGESIELLFAPEAADQVFLLVSLELAPLQLAGFDGALLPGLSGSLLLALGAPGGPVSVPAKLPSDLLGADQGLGLVLQALYLDGADKHAGPGTLLTVLDESLQDSFECDGIWVDDDAPGDPAPGDPSSGDPLEDGSAEHPYDSIQEAIDAAPSGSKVVLRDGVYDEPGSGPIRFNGKFLRVESEHGPEACIVEADDTGFLFGFEPPGTELRGVTVRGAEVVGVRIDTTSEIILTDCVIRECSGPGLTVGVFAQPLIRDCLFVDNLDGALVVGNIGVPVVERCRFLDNASSTVGAGILVESGGLLTLRDSILSGNAALFGSGLFVQGTAIVSRCTLAHNPSGPGSELLVTEDGVARIDNSIVWGGIAPIHLQGNATLEIDWSDVKGGQAGLSMSGVGQDVSWGAHTVDVLPHFKDVPAGDLHLKAGSPCRDAGDPAYLPPEGQTDIDGQPRVQGAALDLGADELP